MSVRYIVCKSARAQANAPARRRPPPRLLQPHLDRGSRSFSRVLWRRSRTPTPPPRAASRTMGKPHKAPQSTTCRIRSTAKRTTMTACRSKCLCQAPRRAAQITRQPSTHRAASPSSVSSSLVFFVITRDREARFSAAAITATGGNTGSTRRWRPRPCLRRTRARAHASRTRSRTRSRTYPPTRSTHALTHPRAAPAAAAVRRRVGPGPGQRATTTADLRLRHREI